MSASNITAGTAGTAKSAAATSSASASKATANTILSIQGVDRVYVDDDNEATKALSQVSFDVQEGEFISLIGHSGCGKTTLLRLIAGLDQPQAGQLLLDGEPITGTSPERGYVFQQGSLFPWLTVRQNIAFGLKAQGQHSGIKEKVDEYLELIGLEDFGDAFPHQISGGMAQRVAIARSLIDNPRLLLLDEPMGALDSFTRADLQDKLLSLWEKNHTTMILVTHDVDEAIYLSDRIVLMTPRPGRVAEIIPVNIERPRDRASEEFLALRASIIEKLHLSSAVDEEAEEEVAGEQASAGVGSASATARPATARGRAAKRAERRKIAAAVPTVSDEAAASAATWYSSLVSKFGHRGANRASEAVTASK